jgi:hypothetical protein
MYDSRTDKGRGVTSAGCRCDYCYPEMRPGYRARQERAWMADVQADLLDLPAVPVVAERSRRRRAAKARHLREQEARLQAQRDEDVEAMWARIDARIAAEAAERKAAAERAAAVERAYEQARRFRTVMQFTPLVTGCNCGFH